MSCSIDSCQNRVSVSLDWTAGSSSPLTSYWFSSDRRLTTIFFQEEFSLLIPVKIAKILQTDSLQKIPQELRLWPWLNL